MKFQRKPILTNHQATWDQLDSDSLLKRQASNRVNSSFNTPDFSALGGGPNSRIVSDLHGDLSNLRRSQTPLQGALSASPSISSIGTNTLPPGLQPIANTNSTNTIVNDSNLTLTNNDKSQKNDEDLTDMDRYGLNGLIPLFKMENNDQTTVAIGTDLNILGLDMSARSIDVKLSKTFPSPWLETSRSEMEPYFVAPSFLTVENLPKIQEKLNLFTDETLFYIFYTNPKDLLQELSARELMNRNWRYHKELLVWLTKDANTEPIQQSPQSERGVYIFFDPHSWEKVRKEFILYYQSIMS